MKSTLTIAVPTIGRPGLIHTLESIKRQALIAGDQVLIVYDSFAKDDAHAERTKQLVQSYGFTFVEHNGWYHFQGNPQLNHAISLARTDFFCALGDDDVYTDGAIARLRKKLQPGRVVLFRFFITGFLTGLYGLRFLLWSDKEVRLANLSGCCMAAPLSALVPVSTELRMDVDYDWIRDTVAKSGRRPYWFQDCLVIARPDERNGEVVHRGVGSCRGCGWVGYLEDMDADKLCEACAPTVIRELLETSA
jgi:glycosyltransferase involved in cell wall biosynthesis